MKTGCETCDFIGPTHGENDLHRSLHRDLPDLILEAFAPLTRPILKRLAKSTD